jgi:hypothetical protein
VLESSIIRFFATDRHERRRHSNVSLDVACVQVCCAYVLRRALKLDADTAKNVAGFDVVAVTHYMLHPNLSQNASLIRECALRVYAWIKANIPNYRRIVIGSDNCTGQNKNGLLIRTLCALAKEGEQVRYTTTEKGHGKGVWDGEGGVLKRAARIAEEDGQSDTIDDTAALYKWACAQHDLLNPLRKRKPTATTKVPIVKRVVHFLESVDERDVVGVPGSNSASSIVPYNLGKRVLFQRHACMCTACMMTEPDATGCDFPHLTRNVDKKIYLLD